MAYKIKTSTKAGRQLAKLNSNIKTQITDWINTVLSQATDPFSVGHYKKLKGKWDGDGRYRVGNYRVIVDIEGDTITILRVEDRKNVYRSSIMKYTLKQRVQGGYRKTEYEIKASALPKLFAYAKKVKAEVFDEEDNLVDIETKGKEQILMAAINSEWETIRGYEASIDLFTEDEQAVIRDIIKEEKVHIGQFQAILDNIGSDVSPSIEEGVNEGQEQLGGDIELLEASMKRHRPSRRNASTKRSMNEKLESVEIWGGDNLNDWQNYDMPEDPMTVEDYAEWCQGEDSNYWATINYAEDKIRLNGWYVLDGEKLGYPSKI